MFPFAARQLYFTELYSGKVEVVNLDGTGRHQIISQNSRVFRSITLDDNFLYIADAEDR